MVWCVHNDPCGICCVGFTYMLVGAHHTHLLTTASSTLRPHHPITDSYRSKKELPSPIHILLRRYLWLT